MTAPTHIIGSYIFAGTMCSFYNINLFQKPAYLALCAIAAIFPDIDTTNSTAGKIFYPIARIINRKFGHRTITHSLLFLLIIYTILTALTRTDTITDTNITTIVTFSLISHFILDMLTVQGIPFFYPFLRNACVIPGNPTYRFKTGDIRHETIVSGVCGLLCFTFQPLFSNGFWTSYNRAFGTVQHVHRENNNTEYYILCDYEYVENAKIKTGSDYVIESKTNEIKLFNPHTNTITTINNDNPNIKVTHTKPRLSDIPKTYSKIQFFNINIDSVNSILKNKLASGLIQSNYNIKYVDNAITYNTNFLQFTHKFNLNIQAQTDTIKTTTAAQLRRLQAAEKEHKQKFNKKLEEYNRHMNKIKTLQAQVDSINNSPNNNLYQKDKIQKELITLHKTTKDKPQYEPDISTQIEIQNIQKISAERKLQFSGHLTILHFNQQSITQPQQ